jgi:hypothetical protein
MARALLGVTPGASDARDEVRRIAFGPVALPGLTEIATMATPGVSAPAGQLGPLAAAALSDGRNAFVVASPLPGPSALAPGWTYDVVVRPTATGPDGMARFPIPVGQARAVRWHEASMEAVMLGPGVSGLIVRLELTFPGPGAPSASIATLVSTNGDRFDVLLSEPAGEEREEPIGCRLGWRAEIALADGDGDETIDSARISRSDFVRARLPAATTPCQAREASRTARAIPLRRGDEVPRDGGLPR